MIYVLFLVLLIAAPVAHAACVDPTGSEGEQVYNQTHKTMQFCARDLFKAIGDGILHANINYEYPLKDAVQAHQAIESGKMIGARVLIP